MEISTHQIANELIRTEPRGYRRSRRNHRRAFSIFAAHFTTPLIWGLEAATVMLIIAFRSTELVKVAVVANLSIIVLMMALKASLGPAREPRSEANGVHARPRS